MWTVLIQCRLVGKAIRVYNALEEGVAQDYQKVKSLVLKAYDLVPEAYRLRFRNYTKLPAQSFVEFARIKEEQFDDWLKSRQVVTFAALRELLLLEEFKKACSRELRVHPEEVKATKVSNAAQLADEYVLTHWSGGRDMGRVQGESPPPRVFVNRGYPNKGTTRSNNNGNRGSGRRGTCYWCNKPGHFQSQCNTRRRYLERNGQSPVAVIPDRSNVNSSAVDRSVVDSSSVGYDQITELAVVDSLPIPGIDGILGNDMLDSEGRDLFPILSVNASPVTVTTQSAARAANLLDEDNDDDLMLSSIIVPSQFRKSVLELAHTNFFLGHLGMLKTFHSLARYFWWPGMKLSVKQFIRECETCQVMGKPTRVFLKPPLHPLPAIGEPFSELVIDVVWSPSCNSDRLWDEFHDEWDKALPFALFAIRNHPNSSTGVAPFELVFGHKVQGPLEIMFEMLKSNQNGEVKVGGLVEDLRSRMLNAWKFARENLEQSQSRMKEKFDKKVKVHSFEPGELVLVLSMDPDSFLEPRYKGPWKVLRNLSDVNYEIEAPGSSRKCRIFHINRLKPYVGKCGDPLAIVYEPVSVVVDVPPEESDDLVCQVPSDALGENMQNLELLKSSLGHLNSNQREEVLNLIYSFSEVFQDAPGRTQVLSHDVDVGDASPVKQSPYRLNPVKLDLVSKEINYTLKHDLIQPSVSPWSSPIVLVKKADVYRGNKGLHPHLLASNGARLRVIAPGNSDTVSQQATRDGVTQQATAIGGSSGAQDVSRSLALMAFDWQNIQA
ncbi:uncharacterized protein [Macrobrachium rosenbergii]|uniref:uncharacterized protein n=1 Tax=Macrobrachium rosenbergii TaxID=79674 RepID=UPI0034D46EAE